MSASKVDRDPLARLGTGTVILVFTASWCVPGTILGKVAAQLVTETGADIRLVDIDTWPQHAEQFRVISVPTVVKVVNKSEKKRLIGAVGRTELLTLT